MTTVNTLIRASFALAGALLACGGLGALITFVALRSDALSRSADLYEACVADQYGMTPVAYYQTHGSYPECETR